MLSWDQIEHQRQLSKNPHYKLYSRYKKEYLIKALTNAGLSIEGTKEELALRYAQYDSERFSRSWDVISGRVKT